MRQRGRKAVTGRRIRVDSRRRRQPVGHGEGFLLATLLQSVLCAMMLALAFAASQYWGLTGIKSCFAAALSQETEAAEVFAAVQRARDSQPAGRLRDWISETIDAALGLGGHSVQDGKGGQLPAGGDEPPSGMMAALPVLSAAARQPVRGELTSPFGYREHPITGQRDFHTGTDLAAPEGDAYRRGLSRRSGRGGEVGGLRQLCHPVSWRICYPLLSLCGDYRQRGNEAETGRDGGAGGKHGDIHRPASAF